MDGGCIRKDQAVEFAALVDDLTAVEIDRDFARLGADALWMTSKTLSPNAE